MVVPRHALNACVLAIVLLPVAPARVLYSQPAALDLGNASVVRVNPTSTPQGQTLVDFWRLGDVPALAPVAWPMGAYTGSPVSAALTRGLTPLAAGSCAMSYAEGVFGATLDTADLTPGQTLGTITVENNWGAGDAASPWAADGAVDCSVFYQASSAARATGAVAVYSSWSLGIRSAVDAAFIWFETALFDLDRPLGGDEIWHDTISGNVIIHGVLGAPSAFHTAAPDSAAASTSTWQGFRRMHFTVSAAQLASAIAAANAQFNLSLHADPALWALVHFNVELEGTANVTAGHSLRGLTITAL